MAFIRQNSFDSIWASGTALTSQSTGNTGGPAGDAFNSVFSSAGNTMEFHSAVKMHGGQGLRIVNGGGASATLGWDDRTDREWGVSDTIHTRSYFRFTAFHNATLFIQHARQDSINASGYSVRLTSDGYLQMYQRNGANVLGQMLNPISLNTFYRIEAKFGKNGAWALRCYVGDSYVPFSPEISGTGVATGMSTGFEFIRWGVESTSGMTLTCYMDDVAYADDWIGPLPTGVSSPVSVTSNTYGWDASAGTTLVDAVGDATDTTYAESPETTATYLPIRYKVGAVDVGDIAVVVRLAGDATPTARIRLYQGGGLIATWTQNLTLVPTDYRYVLTLSQQNTVTDRNDLYLEVAGIK